MKEEPIICRGVPHYFQPHQIALDDSYISNEGAHCMPCLYLSLALQGKNKAADKLLRDNEPFIPIAIDSFVMQYEGQL